MCVQLYITRADISQYKVNLICYTSVYNITDWMASMIMSVSKHDKMLWSCILTIRNPYWMTFSVYSFSVKSPSGCFNRSRSKKLDNSLLFASNTSLASSVLMRLILLQQSQGQAFIRQHQLGRLLHSFLISLRLNINSYLYWNQLNLTNSKINCYKEATERVILICYNFFFII